MGKGIQTFRGDGVTSRGDINKIPSSSGDSGIPGLIETTRYIQNLAPKLLGCLSRDFMRSIWALSDHPDKFMDYGPEAAQGFDVLWKTFCGLVNWDDYRNR